MRCDLIIAKRHHRQYRRGADTPA
jgi:hypothetical protein